MVLEFSGEVIRWRGPAPYYFVAVPDEPAAAIEHVSSMVTYGWGCIPVRVRVGRTDFTTSLFPKDDGYLVPIKVAVRRAERVELGDEIAVRIELDV